MSLINDIETKTELGVIEKVYFRIPRTQREHFYDWFSEKHLAFEIQMWRGKEVRDLIDQGYKPFRTISVRINNCTQQDIDGVPGVPGVHIDGKIISDPIPPIIGRRETWLPDEIEFAFDEVFDMDKLAIDIAKNLTDMVEAKAIDPEKEINVSEATSLAVVGQVYEYINTLTDFLGIDMTQAVKG